MTMQLDFPYDIRLLAVLQQREIRLVGSLERRLWRGDTEELRLLDQS